MSEQKITSFNSTTNSLSTTKLNIDDNNSYTCLDDAKQVNCCSLSMTQAQRNKISSCYWCKQPFDNTGIGCPIEYSQYGVIKEYYSEITKDTYTINGSTSSEDLVSDMKDVDIVSKPTYVMDGMFCSFNCCLAFIKDNRHNSLYKNSEQILYTLYRELFPNSGDTPINPAPHWRLLTTFGGNMDINEFRQSFDTIGFESTNQYITKALQWIYKNNIKF